MLKQLRHKKTAKKVWIILAAIIVPAFVLWGSGSLIRSKQEANYAGMIFGKKISFLEYRDAMEAVKNAAVMQFGDKFNEMRKFLNLESQAWQRLILLHEAKKRKIKASDREVIGLIQSYPFFQRQGRFDNRLYNETLQYVFNTQPRFFEEQNRQDIMISKLYYQVTRGVKVDEEEIKYEYAKENQEISVYYIAGIFADFSKEITSPSEQNIQDYFNQNSLEFKQPLSFDLDYISQDSQDKIEQISSKLKKKEDLENLAKDAGIEVKHTGLFSQADPIPGIGWSPEILNLVSKLKVGEFSPVMQVDKNFCIFFLKERKETYIPDFKDIKDRVKDSLIKNESAKIAKEKVEDCLKQLKELYKQNPKSADFEKTAKEYGLKSGSTDNFKYGSYIEGIGASDTIWMKAKELKEDEFSDCISMPAGFYIIKVKNIVPIDEKTFESEKQKFSQNILSLKKQEYFSKFVNELIRKGQ
jgi:peptidyl-prolyl cis-trans isomerase D